MSVFPFLKPNPMQPVCTCGHLKYTHRYLGGKFSCAAQPTCSCIEYMENTNATA